MSNVETSWFFDFRRIQCIECAFIVMKLYHLFFSYSFHTLSCDTVSLNHTLFMRLMFYPFHVRKILPDFAVCDRWRYFKALCDEECSPIEGSAKENVSTFYIQLNNSIICIQFSNSVQCSVNNCYTASLKREENLCITKVATKLPCFIMPTFLFLLIF